MNNPIERRCNVSLLPTREQRAEQRGYLQASKLHDMALKSIQELRAENERLRQACQCDVETLIAILDSGYAENRGLIQERIRETTIALGATT
jgi:hypothetical protein